MSGCDPEGKGSIPFYHPIYCSGPKIVIEYLKANTADLKTKMRSIERLIMSPELDKKLVEDFPLLFRNRHGDPRTTAMCWGFECGDGWEPLIREVASKLEPMIASLATDENLEQGSFCASQVKEKFGTLRFYLSSGTDEMYSLVNEAENKSAEVCELCGNVGTVMGTYWLVCRCENCAKRDVMFDTIIMLKDRSR